MTTTWVLSQESPAFDESNLEEQEFVSDRTLTRSASTTFPATATSLPKSPPPKTSSSPIKRSQNLAKTQSVSQSVSTPSNEEIFRENSDIDHFFEGADENFPELDSYGVGWESRKLASWKAALMAEQEQTRAGSRRRRKREAYEPPLYYSADRTRLSGRPQLWRGGVRERQYGEVGGTGWERQSLEWGLRERQDQGERGGGVLLYFRILGGRRVWLGLFPRRTGRWSLSSDDLRTSLPARSRGAQQKKAKLSTSSGQRKVNTPSLSMLQLPGMTWRTTRSLAPATLTLSRVGHSTKTTTSNTGSTGDKIPWSSIHLCPQ